MEPAPPPPPGKRTRLDEGILGQFDHFRKPLTTKQIERAHWAYYQPSNTITDGQPITFSITGVPDYMLDIANSRLKIVGKFFEKQQGADKALTSTSDFYPVNNLLHSLFKQVDCALNKQQVSPSSQLYPFKAYFQKKFNFTKEYKDTALSSVLWKDDDAAYLKQTTFQTGIYTPTKPNLDKSGVWRNSFVKESHQVELIDKLHIDIFNTDKYLLNNVGVEIKLYPADPKFYTMVDSETSTIYFKILEAEFQLIKVKPKTNLLLAEMTQLNNEMAIFSITHSNVKPYNIYAGTRTVNVDNVFTNFIPNRIIMGMIDIANFEGAYKTNPFYFKHNSLNFLAAYIDGVQVPSKAYQPDFDTVGSISYLQCYVDFLDCIEKWGNGKSINMTRDQWKEGNTFFALDLTSGLTAGSGVFNAPRLGNVRLEIHFAKAIVDPITLLIYSESDHIMNIDSNYSVALDYNI
jgi:hypothetical protein